MNLLRNAVSLCRRSHNVCNKIMASACNRSIHTTSTSYDLMEFFDTKKNWGETNIKVGRGWRLDELRIKSSADLHKLWYVLLKERNMLYTMEQLSNDKMKMFANPERIDKVKDSMDNIEKVIKERNTAYYELETGETGERPVEDVVNLFGLPEKYEKKEYSIPRHMNTRWVRTYLNHGLMNSAAVKKFYRLMKEKDHISVKRERNRNFNQVQHLLKRFPNMDLAKLKQEYPDVDIDKAMSSKKSRGHFMPRP